MIVWLVSFAPIVGSGTLWFPWSFSIFVWICVGVSIGAVPVKPIIEPLLNRNVIYGLVAVTSLAIVLTLVYMAIALVEVHYLNGFDMANGWLLGAARDIVSDPFVALSFVSFTWIFALAIAFDYNEVDGDLFGVLLPRWLTNRVDSVAVRLLALAITIFLAFAGSPGYWPYGVLVSMPVIWGLTSIAIASAFTRIAPWRLRSVIGDLAHDGLLMRESGVFRLPHEDVAIAVTRIALEDDPRPSSYHSLLPTWIGVRVISTELDPESYGLSEALLPHFGRRRQAGDLFWGAVWQQRPGGNIKSSERMWTKAWRRAGDRSDLIRRAITRHRLGRFAEADGDIARAIRGAKRMSADDDYVVVRALRMRGDEERLFAWFDAREASSGGGPWPFYRLAARSLIPEHSADALSRLRTLVKKNPWGRLTLAIAEWETGDGPRAAWKTLTTPNDHSDLEDSLDYWLTRTALAIRLKYPLEADAGAHEIRRRMYWSTFPEVALPAYAILRMHFGDQVAAERQAELLSQNVRLWRRPQLSTLLDLT